MQALIEFLGIQNVIPHGYCLSWNSMLLWLNVASDIAIALSNYSIPLSLLYFIRKRKDLPYSWLFLMFGLFVVACGTTHLMSAVLIWIPLYWIDGYLKLFTAIIAIATAIAMLRIIPLALKLPTTEQLQIEIDERKQIELDLQASEFCWKFAIEGSGDGLWDWDIKNHTVFFSPRWKEIFGFSNHEIENNFEEWEKRVHPDDKVSVLQMVTDYLEGKIDSYICEHRVKCKNGTYKWILARGIVVSRSDDGKPLRMIGTNTDISNHKEMEQQLKDSEKQLSKIIDILPVPLVMNDNKPDIVFLNRTFIETFGYDLNDIPTLETWWEVAYPDLNYRQWVIETWFELLAKMQRDNTLFVPLEVVIRCKNGSTKNVLVSAAQISDSLHLVALYDITEHKKTELELARSNADLEQFAYAVSHDMRQPLRMVRSYLSLIESTLSNQLDDETRQFLNFAVDGATRMDSMILSLLEYSRTGRTDVFELISSKEAVEEAMLFLTPVLKISGGNVEISGDWVEVVANQDELTRLLQNLIGNALKYHAKNKPPQVQVLAITTQNTFRVEVKDSGIGIEPSQTERLFKVFSRLQSRSHFEGTGVGLALCRKIVEHHDGKIGVQSQGEGFGSTFWFEIPMINNKAA
jgi:PAS domain S-box-containing protein